MILEIFRYCEHLDSVDFYLKHGVDELEELQVLEAINMDIDDLFETKIEVFTGVDIG